MPTVKLYDVTVTHKTKRWSKELVVVGGENAHALETEEYHFRRIVRQCGYDPYLELYSRDKITIKAKFKRELDEYIEIF